MREPSKKQKERYRYSDADREEWCKKTSMEMARSSIFSLIEENGIVYMEKEGKKEVLCDPINPKKIWEETLHVLQDMTFEWLKKKERVSKRVL